MPAITEKTVREFALETPAAIRVFESFGIDYCCGGARPLSEACARADVDPDRVLGLIGQASREPQVPADDWAGKTLSELIAHIVSRHHTYVQQEVPRILSLLQKVTAKHGPAHPEVIQLGQRFAAVGQELSTHLMKEEQVLFPYIEQLEDAVIAGQPAPVPFFGTVRNPVAMMIAEHQTAGALLAGIRELSNDYQPPAGVCLSFVALYRGLEDFERDLHRHIHLENNILFPRALALEER